MSFINKTDFSRELTILMTSFISSFEIINVVIPDPNIFLYIAASVPDAAAINPNGIKTLLANGFNTFLLTAIQFLVMVLKFYPKILLIFLLYATEYFNNFILAEELLYKPSKRVY